MDSWQRESGLSKCAIAIVKAAHSGSLDEWCNFLSRSVFASEPEYRNAMRAISGLQASSVLKNPGSKRLFLEKLDQLAKLGNVKVGRGTEIHAATRPEHQVVALYGLSFGQLYGS